MKIWAKEFSENRLVRDMTIEDNSLETRTHKVFNALEKVCLSFDLEKPIWLDKNIKEFKRVAKTRFTQDSFIELVEFDYLELQIIEED